MASPMTTASSSTSTVKVLSTFKTRTMVRYLTLIQRCRYNWTKLITLDQVLLKMQMNCGIKIYGILNMLGSLELSDGPLKWKTR